MALVDPFPYETNQEAEDALEQLFQRIGYPYQRDQYGRWPQQLPVENRRPLALDQFLSLMFCGDHMFKCRMYNQLYGDDLSGEVTLYAFPASGYVLAVVKKYTRAGKLGEEWLALGDREYRHHLQFFRLGCLHQMRENPDFSRRHRFQHRWVCARCGYGRVVDSSG